MNKIKEFLLEKKNQKIVVVLGIISAVLIMLGVTYAFFTYARNGSTENTIKSGSITFLYDEINRSGNSIGIVDALPTSDTDGKAQTNAFNFKIVSNTATDMAIPYEITLRQKQGTDNIGDKIKVYLSKTSGYEAPVNTENEVKTSLFSTLPTTTHNGYSERTLHTDEVPTSAVNYEQNYRLKMWLDESVDLSNEAYNGKTFTVMVNVYANGRIASSNANIESVAVNNTVLIAVNANEYETTLEPNTTQATVAIETEDDNSTVTITKTESDYETPIAESGEIQRLSNTVNRTVDLTEGDNYFKIVVTSENNLTTKEQHLKITVPESSFVLKDRILSNNTLRTETPDFTTTYPKIATYTDDNFSGSVSSFRMSSTYQSYYYTYADSYTFNMVTGKYTLVNPQVCKYSSCPETLKNKYIVSYLGNSSSKTVNSSNLSAIYKITEDTTLDTMYYILSSTTPNYDSSISGLYSMNVSNGFSNGKNGVTYYFRGTVNNNYVSFDTWGKDIYVGYNTTSAYVYNRKVYNSLSECQSDASYNLNCTKLHDADDPIYWRIIRINEDGTVRLQLDDVIPKASKLVGGSNYNSMYYSVNPIAKTEVETWYNEYITGENATKVASGNYFCEAAKVATTSTAIGNAGNALMVYPSNYTPDLKCQTDGNNKGLLNNSVGLINYDEVVLAGGYYNLTNNSYYLYNGYNWWTMSPAGVPSNAAAWIISTDRDGTLSYATSCCNTFFLRPVINLKADVTATGTGTASDPYVVQ